MHVNTHKYCGYTSSSNTRVPANCPPIPTPNPTSSYEPRPLKPGWPWIKKTWALGPLCFSSAWPTSHLPLTPPSVRLDASVTSTHGMLLSPPPGSIIYCVFHLALHLIYIGVTTAALVSRLRKHMTDATSHQDCATLHRLMLQVDMGGWGILPLQYVLDPLYASVRERHWWFVFTKWACNDVPPGICSPDSSQRSRGWLNQRVLAILQGIRDAKRIRDFARLKWLQHDLRDLASKLSVPLYVVGTVVVPNLTPNQKAAIHRVCRKLVGSVVGAAWEKQALNKGIRITRSTPQTVRRVFERKARQYYKLQAQPPCSCHQASNIPGTRIIIDGHVALCPIAIPYHDGSTAGPNDPLPLNGHKVRQQLLQDLTTMAQQIGATLPPPLTYLPPALWPESGARLRPVVQLANQVTKHFYVRIVDKGVGVMWGFWPTGCGGSYRSFLPMKATHLPPETLPRLCPPFAATSCAAAGK